MEDSSKVVLAVKKVLPSVVNITVSKDMQILAPQKNLFGGFGLAPSGKKKKMQVGGGSGFIVDEKGLILTNRHVVEDPTAEYLVVLQNGEKIKPEILARDPIHDIAILQIDKQGLPFVELADSSLMDLGQTVIAIGNALGIFQNTVSTGVISGLSREIKAQSDFSMEQTKLRGLIQTDAAINPGNSGGPLIDLEGRAVGVNAAMVFGAENIGFALPINNAKTALSELKKYGRVRQPFFGVRYIPVNEIIQQEFKLPVNCGALVISEPDIHNLQKNIQQAVVPNSPAHRAGIQESDIILEIKNKKIDFENSISDILQDCQIGETIPVKVMRGGKDKILSLVLGEKK